MKLVFQRARRCPVNVIVVALALLVSMAGGQCPTGTTTFAVSPMLSFTANAGTSNITTTAQGCHVTGTVTVTTPFTSLDLTQVSISFAPAPGPFPVQVSGTVRAPLQSLPGIGPFITSNPSATIGIMTRAQLRSQFENADTTLPLAENEVPGSPGVLIEPVYLVLHYSTTIGLGLPINEFMGSGAPNSGEPFFSLPGGSLTVILDPTDPFLYVARDGMLGVTGGAQTPIGLEVNAVAFSAGGGIPFRTDQAWGVPPGVGNFKGHAYLNGAFTYDFVTVEGDVVAKAAPNDIEVAGNGVVSIGVDFGALAGYIPGLVDLFTVELGSGSAGWRISPQATYVWAAGVKHTESPLIDALPFPITMGPGMHAAMFLDALQPLNSYAGAYGSCTIGGPDLSNVLGVNINQGMHIDGTVVVGVFGLTINGTTTWNPIPGVAAAWLQVDAYFPTFNQSSWYITLRGQMTVGGVPLVNGTISISNSGFFISGTVNGSVVTVNMSGQITSAGASLTGQVTVNMAGAVNNVLNAAQAAVQSAQQEVNSLNATVAYNNSLIAGYAAELAAGPEICVLGVCSPNLAYIAWLGIQIAALEAENLGILAIQGALWVAEVALSEAESALTAVTPNPFNANLSFTLNSGGLSAAASVHAGSVTVAGTVTLGSSWGLSVNLPVLGTVTLGL